MPQNVCLCATQQGSAVVAVDFQCLSAQLDSPAVFAFAHVNSSDVGEDRDLVAQYFNLILAGQTCGLWDEGRCRVITVKLEQVGASQWSNCHLDQS